MVAWCNAFTKSVTRVDGRVWVYELIPQNKWLQLVWTGNLGVCRQTGHCQSCVFVDRHGGEDS